MFRTFRLDSFAVGDLVVFSADGRGKVWTVGAPYGAGTVRLETVRPCGHVLAVTLDGDTVAFPTNRTA